MGISTKKILKKCTIYTIIILEKCIVAEVMVNMTISEKIFCILSEKELSQKEFSEKTGISQSTISDWKRKGTNPAADKIMAICDALNISVYQLLDGNRNNDENELDYVILSKESEEYLFLEKFQDLDKNAKQRLKGYMEALKSK